MSRTTTTSTDLDGCVTRTNGERCTDSTTRPRPHRGDVATETGVGPTAVFATSMLGSTGGWERDGVREGVQAGFENETSGWKAHLVLCGLRPPCAHPEGRKSAGTSGEYGGASPATCN